MVRIPLPKRGRIAVLELHGSIGGRVKPAQVLPLIEAVRRAGHFRAAVLDIDSGGGSATASEELYLALGRLAAAKPLVAYVRGHGASGAYMAACAAQRIVSLPHGIVGSIGVLSLHPIVEQLFHRLGVQVSVHKSGSLKDMGALYRQPTDAERQKLQELVDQFYEAFVDIVARARKLDREKVRGLATGEVFLGERARELGLVDEVGDFERALDVAAELGKVPRRPVWVRPKRGMVERLVGRFASSLAEAVTAEVDERLRSGGFGRYL